MKQFLILALFAFVINAQGQITLEQHYPSAGEASRSVFYTVFSSCEFKYYQYNNTANTLTVYNIDHSVYKNITIPAQPPQVYSTGYQLYAVSNMIFDTDSNTVEYIIIGRNTTPPLTPDYYNIYNENGNILFSDSSIGNYGSISTGFIDHLSVYNTPDGPKLMLHYPSDNSASVFDLPGEFPQNCPYISKVLNNENALDLGNPFPNPIYDFVTIPYKLPNGINQGKILIYDIQGNVIKEYLVDKTFSNLKISTNDISAGTYYYQLQTSTNNSQGKKIIIIK